MKLNRRYKEEIVVKTKNPFTYKKKTPILTKSEDYAQKNTKVKPNSTKAIPQFQPDNTSTIPVKVVDKASQDSSTIINLQKEIQIQKKILQEKEIENKTVQLELDSKTKKLSELEALTSKVTNTINEITSYNSNLRKEVDRLETAIASKKRLLQNQNRLASSREVLENYLLSIMMQMREESEANNYPNPDNMTYEELLELEEKIGSVSKGLSKEKINSIQVVKFRKNDYPEDKCIVCQYEFKEWEKVKLLKCKHCFHPECIDQWLMNQKVCPFCKEEVK